jgi:hypothetical protein
MACQKRWSGHDVRTVSTPLPHVLSVIRSPSIRIALAPAIGLSLAKFASLWLRVSNAVSRVVSRAWRVSRAVSNALALRGGRRSGQVGDLIRGRPRAAIMPRADEGEVRAAVWAPLHQAAPFCCARQRLSPARALGLTACEALTACRLAFSSAATNRRSSAASLVKRPCL